MEIIENKLDEIVSLLKAKNLQEKEFLTLEEASIYIGQPKSSINKLTSKKQIPFYVPNGKKIYFKATELNDWITCNRIDTVDDLENSVNDYLISKS